MADDELIAADDRDQRRREIAPRLERDARKMADGRRLSARWVRRMESVLSRRHGVPVRFKYDAARLAIVTTYIGGVDIRELLPVFDIADCPEPGTPEFQRERTKAKRSMALVRVRGRAKLGGRRLMRRPVCAASRPRERRARPSRRAAARGSLDDGSDEPEPAGGGRLDVLVPGRAP